jgi:hypothetical protein
MAQKALTDYDENNYHDNEILNILEASCTQIYYQNDKDWNYITTHNTTNSCYYY